MENLRIDDIPDIGISPYTSVEKHFVLVCGPPPCVTGLTDEITCILFLFVGVGFLSSKISSGYCRLFFQPQLLSSSWKALAY